MKINIVGAGRVGQTIGRLLADTKALEIGSVYNRTKLNSHNSVAFIGEGTPIDSLSDMGQADLYMVTTSDNALNEICHRMFESHDFKKGSVVFHCSGVAPSLVFERAKVQGCYVASVHPVKSFAEPSLAITNFNGTFCGVEGDEEALHLLEECFQTIGGKVFRINTDKKAMYHAATVMACNNLVALMEASTSMYIDAGLDRSQALKVMEPIVRGTITNVFALGAVPALTGPIARGDGGTIKKHIDALASDDGMLKGVYCSLGKWALELSRKQGCATNESLNDIQKQLNAIDKDNKN